MIQELIITLRDKLDPTIENSITIDFDQYLKGRMEVIQKAIDILNENVTEIYFTRFKNK